MKPATVAGILFSHASAASVISVASRSTSSNLYVDVAPQYLRPYVLPRGSGEAVRIGNQVYRFAVTGNSSDSAFLLMNTNAPDSTQLGVLPHIHKAHYENFYCAKGRAQSNLTSESPENTRILTAGDYGAVPQDTTHTFQILDPDTVLTGVIYPGGFEKLFIDIRDDFYNSTIGSPFPPANLTAPAAGDPCVIEGLQFYDVWAELGFSPRTDVVNGIAGSGNWHNGSNELAPDSSTPNFIAENYGPKYLNSNGGVYSIIAPLVEKTQSAGNFSMGTITLSPLLSNLTAASASFNVHHAFQVEEGQLAVTLSGETANLINGDVIFIPANSTFTYWATVPFTKFLYVTGGSTGLDAQLLQGAQSWDYASYPQYD